jgi:hypothetical protein
MEAVRWFPKSAPQWERLAAWKTSRNFFMTAQNIQPLPGDIIDAITKLHYRWSDELDRKAEVWSL